MGENKSWSGIGAEIRDAVEAALTKGDFTGLSDVVVDAVTDTVKGVTSEVRQAVSGAQTMNQTQKWENATRERKRMQEEQLRMQTARETERFRRRAPFRKVGSVSSVLFRVFGGIGAGIFGAGLLIQMMLSIFGIAMDGVFGAFLPLAVSIVMICVGVGRRKRLELAERYLELAGNNHYINIEDLALLTNESPDRVRKNVKKMLKAGFFPQGHLDVQETCLMLDNKIYQEYLDLERQRRAQEREQMAQEMRAAAERQPVQDTGAQKAAAQAGGATQSKDPELDAMIAEGQEYIRKLRELNDNIPGEEISAKLFRLENLLKEIFDGLRVHPEQKHQMQKFMNYYLPTTLKLVSAYDEFDDLSTQGAEITEAKAEIEKTLDTINGAFAELLNRLFRDTAYDVTTDAQVLQTMLAKEGLTGQGSFAGLGASAQGTEGSTETVLR